MPTAPISASRSRYVAAAAYAAPPSGSVVSCTTDQARRQWPSTEKIAASVSSARASAVVAVWAASTSLTSRLPA